MINNLKARSAAIATGLALMTILSILSGCTRSALDLSRHTQVNRPAANLSASDLSVRESYSASTQWFESYDNAHRESLRTGKPIMMVFSGSDWCGPCIELKKKVFESSEFQQWAGDKAVLLELDFPKKSHQDPAIQAQNKRLSRQYNISGYPTVLFVDSDGTVLGRQGHGRDAGQWIASAERTLR